MNNSKLVRCPLQYYHEETTPKNINLVQQVLVCDKQTMHYDLIKWFIEQIEDIKAQYKSPAQAVACGAMISFSKEKYKKVFQEYLC